MPQFDASAPTLDRKFADFDISVPAVFTEGHALTDAEAAWVNGQLATVVGNAFGGFIRRSKEANKKFSIDASGAQSKFDEIFADYEFGAGRGSGKASGTDPVDALARALAVADLKARIVAAGRSVKALQAKGSAGDGTDKSMYSKLLEDSIALGHNKAGVSFREMAQAQLDAAAANAGGEDELLAGLEPEAPAEAA